MDQNVGSSEKIFSSIAGAAAVGYGLSKRSLGGTLLALIGGVLLKRGATGKCDVYNALGMSTADPERQISMQRTIIVRKPASELFAFWRKLENLPRFMNHLERVEQIDDKRSRWRARTVGVPIEWEAMITDERPGSYIAWQSMPNAIFQNSGRVTFTDRGNDQTEVKVRINYTPVAGHIGEQLAKLFGQNPKRVIREDLERFRMLFEAGEGVRTGAAQRQSGAPLHH